jgi:hypothetical protein
MISELASVRLRLRNRITCPHCWHEFSPEETLWIAEDPGLMGDPRLGDEYPLRFLPTRFDVAGNAIDPKGQICRDLACPECHLSVPRPLFEMQPLFASIMGSPACGKSYFLAAMTWRLRRVMPKYFAVSFGDADPVYNRILNHYEEEQFFNPHQDKIVKLAKTEEQGDLYDEIRMGDQVVRYPRPFLFSLRSLEGHPLHGVKRSASRLLCLYDNAGESFLPGADTAANPVTRHLARSQLLMFLFDPTQDPRFRAACQGKTLDCQVVNPRVTSRQETVLHEAASRIRRYANLSHEEKHRRPLIVIVTKYDAWASLLPRTKLRKLWIPTNRRERFSLDVPYVEQVSREVRDLLWRVSPEIVSAAEGFAERVLFVPCSATGRAPERDPETGNWGIRPRDIKPVWTEVPLLYALCDWTGGMIARAKHNSDQQDPSADNWPPPT